VTEVYGALEGAIDFVIDLWGEFMASDSETLLLTGTVIGFALALVLGFVSQRVKNPQARPKPEDTNVTGSVGQNMCA